MLFLVLVFLAGELFFFHSSLAIYAFFSQILLPVPSLGQCIRFASHFSYLHSWLLVSEPGKKSKQIAMKMKSSVWYADSFTRSTCKITIIRYRCLKTAGCRHRWITFMFIYFYANVTTYVQTRTACLADWLAQHLHSVYFFSQLFVDSFFFPFHLYIVKWTQNEWI